MLRGYDDVGVARTKRAEQYTEANCAAFVSAIEDSCRANKSDVLCEECGSAQEGEDDSVWTHRLLNAFPSEVERHAAHAWKGERHTNYLASSIWPEHKRPERKQTSHELNETEIELEFWTMPADGAYAIAEVAEGVTIGSLRRQLLSENAYKVSEVGILGKLPSNVAEAREHSHWPLFKAAMEEEIKGKLANRAWDVIKRPANVHVLKSRWVFAIKYNEDGSISVVKVRFVACGYSQQEGSDYDRVFASTLPGVSLRTLVGAVADEDLETDHIDAVKAFTQSDVDHVLYVEMPERRLRRSGLCTTPP